MQNDLCYSCLYRSVIDKWRGTCILKARFYAFHMHKQPVHHHSGQNIIINNPLDKATAASSLLPLFNWRARRLIHQKAECSRLSSLSIHDRNHHSDLYYHRLTSPFNKIKVFFFAAAQRL